MTGMTYEETKGCLKASGWELDAEFPGGATVWRLDHFRRPTLLLYPELSPSGNVATMSLAGDSRRDYRTYSGLVTALRHRGWIRGWQGKLNPYLPGAVR